MMAFGPFTLDEDTQQLCRGGCERPLRAKSFAVLREVVRRRGRLVTKEDLFRACWPNTAVSQTVLRVCISEIRAVLAEDVTGSTAIESVGRRGYRLVARAEELDRPVSPIGASAISPPFAVRWRGRTPACARSSSSPGSPAWARPRC